MDHRTYGETTNCKGCRFWSEMIAMSAPGGIQALCLNPNSGCHTHYTYGASKCDSWASGHDGAIDEPGSDPIRYERETA